jgi:hypothetical protein
VIVLDGDDDDARAIFEAFIAASFIFGVPEIDVG